MGWRDVAARHQSGRRPFKPVILTEDLPYPTTHYPMAYGAFLAFALDEDADPVLCSCSRPAVESLLANKAANSSARNAYPLRNAPLDSGHFPDSVAALSIEAENPLETVAFIEGICHRCLLRTPAGRWCHPMYGGAFKQKHGWYIAQAGLRWGIDGPFLRRYTPLMPPPLMELFDAMDALPAPAGAKAGLRNMTREQWPAVREYQLKQAHIKRRIERLIEDEARKEFGLRKVGEAWVSETLLIKIVREMFPDLEVLDHARPPWLEGLELDVFIPELNVALEYQGQQHYHAIAAWGGAKGLAAVQERDRRKAYICAMKGVILIEYTYREPLDQSRVAAMLGPHIQRA